MERTLPAPSEISELRPFSPGTGYGSEKSGIEDEIEAQIDEDAKAAAPALAPRGERVGEQPRRLRAEEARAGLAAVPPLEDSGPPTQAWQAEPMTIFGQGGDKVAGAKVEAGSSQFTGGPDWIA